jgi:hypothetical protein
MVREDGKDKYKVKGVAASGGTVKVLQKGLSFAGDVDNIFVERSSIIDRDCKLSRTGTGLETEYKLIDKEPKKLTAEDKKIIAEAGPLEEMVKPMSYEEAMKELGKATKVVEEEKEHEGQAPSGLLKDW